GTDIVHAELSDDGDRAALVILRIEDSDGRIDRTRRLHNVGIPSTGVHLHRAVSHPKPATKADSMELTASPTYLSGCQAPIGQTDCVGHATDYPFDVRLFFVILMNALRCRARTCVRASDQDMLGWDRNVLRNKGTNRLHVREG